MTVAEDDYRGFQLMPLFNSSWVEPVDSEGITDNSAGGTCVQDWYEQALQTEAPVRGPRNSWDDEEEEEEAPESPDSDEEVTPDEDIQADPFDDFDPNDFDDEFDEDFEEELDDEYEIEPEDDEILEDIDSPSIIIDDGSGEDDEEVDPTVIPEDIDDE